MRCLELVPNVARRNAVCVVLAFGIFVLSCCYLTYYLGAGPSVFMPYVVFSASAVIEGVQKLT